MKPFDRKVIFGAATLFLVGSAVVLRELLLDEAVRLETSIKGREVARVSQTSKPDIREATIRVLSNTCGNSLGDPSFREQSKLVNEAGPGIVPLLTELVSDPANSDWLVGNACRQAVRYPFSTEFRDAVRTRRDERRIDLQAMFEYFGQFGDQTDLLWLQAKERTEGGYMRGLAKTAVSRLSSRLSSK